MAYVPDRSNAQHRHDLSDHFHECLAGALGELGLRIEYVAHGRAIPGGFRGSSEAGLVGEVLYVRFDTPLHSVLHEAGHFACMNHSRRRVVDTDAGGDDAGEPQSAAGRRAG